MNGTPEQQKRHFITAFNGIVRNTALSSAVEMQRVVIGLDQLLSAFPPDAPLDLGPLYPFLLELKAPEEAVAEAFLALKSREDVLGRTLLLPAEVERLGEAKKRKLLEAYAKRTSPSGVPRKEGPESRADPPRPGEPQVVKPPAPRTRRVVSPPVLLLLVLGLGGSAGVVVYGQKTEPPDSVEVQLKQPGGIVCTQLRVTESLAMCTMSRETFEADSERTRKQRLAVTKRELASRNVRRLLIRTEDGKLYPGF